MNNVVEGQFSGDRSNPARGYDSGNGGGNSGDLRDRVSKLEGHMAHVATKTDIANLKVWILAGVLGTFFLSSGEGTKIIKLFFSD